jgi:hypothetical protein
MARHDPAFERGSLGEHIEVNAPVRKTAGDIGVVDRSATPITHFVFAATRRPARLAQR